MHRASTSGFSSQRSQYRIGICLAVVVLFILATACSTRPRDEFAQEVLAGIDKILSALEQYRANPSGKSTEPVNAEINGRSVRITGPDALLVSQSYAETVGGRVWSFSKQFETVKLPAAIDIQSDAGYDAWAAATDRRLREKADKCLAIVEQIKSEYKANPDSGAYQSFFIGRPYRTVRMTPEGELIFAVNMQDGIMIERILKQDFRAALDALHNYSMKERTKVEKVVTGGADVKALIEASFWGNQEKVLALIAAKIDVNAKDGGDSTALILASREGHLEIVNALIAAKADVNAKTYEGWTALIGASIKGHFDVVEALLAAKADVNAKTVYGNTALMNASSKGHLEVVKALIAANADVNAKDNNGSTALKDASKMGHQDVVKLLKKAGATE